MARCHCICCDFEGYAQLDLWNGWVFSCWCSVDDCHKDIQKAEELIHIHIFAKTIPHGKYWRRNQAKEV